MGPRPQALHDLLCPACRTPLRLRERVYHGAAFPCPECAAALCLRLEDGPARIELSAAAAVPNDAHPSARLRSKNAAATAENDITNGRPQPHSVPAVEPTVNKTTAAEARPNVPSVVGPAIGERKAVRAACAALGLIVISTGVWAVGPAWFDRPPKLSDRSENRHRETDPALATNADQSPAAVSATPPTTPSASPTGNQSGSETGSRSSEGSASATLPAAVPAGPFDARLIALGTRLQAVHARLERYPAVAVEPGQFSWLAELEWTTATLPDGRRPQRDLSWQAAENEAFVGRKLTPLQNPVLTVLVGDDGRPATHVAGIAGVGRDASQLPVTHRRAGVFGIRRRTRQADITDGLAHTAIIGGVEQRLGSWADPGEPTHRPFTATPYIRGQDGWGDGRPDQLSVLLADGRVRTITATTDPIVVRRLAAIADGWPVEPWVPGEPGDLPPRSRPATTDDPQSPPLSALDALAAIPVENRAFSHPANGLAASGRGDSPDRTPPQPLIKRPLLDAVLDQRLQAIDFPKAVPRRQLIPLLEDLLGRPCRLADGDRQPSSHDLDQAVRLDGRDVTTAALLTQWVGPSGLRVVLTEAEFIIERRDDRATPPLIRPRD